MKGKSQNAGQRGARDSPDRPVEEKKKWGDSYIAKTRPRSRGTFSERNTTNLGEMKGTHDELGSFTDGEPKKGKSVLANDVPYKGEKV